MPIHVQIRDGAPRATGAGLPAPGAMMPTLRRVAVALRIDTVCRAHDALARTGAITVQPARGTGLADSVNPPDWVGCWPPPRGNLARPDGGWNPARLVTLTGFSVALHFRSILQRDNPWEPEMTMLSAANRMARVWPAGGAACWLGLAASPTFAVMALIAAIDAHPICSSGSGGRPIDGMAAMYLLMSLFHLSPWLKLASARM